MSSHTPVQCSACNSVYTARKQDDGGFLISTADSRCACGNEIFDEVTNRSEPSDAAAHNESAEAAPATETDARLSGSDQPATDTPKSAFVAVTADYEAKLAEFAQAEELPPERLETLFREHCTTFRAETMDETPNGVIRRLAMAKLRWHLSEDP